MQEPSQIANSYAAMTKERADALLIFQNQFTSFHRKELVELALENRLPTMCEGRFWVDQGCLVSYAGNRIEIARRAASLVDKILKGRKPADLPVEQPDRYTLVVNLRTAQALGIKVPKLVMLRADRVIE